MPVVLWYFSPNCKFPLVRIQCKHECLADFYDVLDTPAAPHLDNRPLQDHPFSCTMAPYLLRREATDGLDWPSRNFYLNLIGNVWCFIKLWSNNPNTIVRNVADLRFGVHRMRMTSLEHQPACRRRVRNLLAAWGDFTDVSFINFKKISALNSIMYSLGLNLISHILSYPL